MHAALILVSLTANAFAAPISTAQEGCLTDDTAAELVAKWSSLLSQDVDAASADSVLTVDYTEYASSVYALNWQCLQSEHINSSRSWTDPVFTRLADYTTAAMSSSRATFDWANPSISHDCSTIGVRGDMHITRDNQLFNAMALLDIQMLPTGAKVFRVFWEFDVLTATNALVRLGQCRRPNMGGAKGIGYIL